VADDEEHEVRPHAEDAAARRAERPAPAFIIPLLVSFADRQAEQLVGNLAREALAVGDGEAHVAAPVRSEGRWPGARREEGGGTGGARGQRQGLGREQAQRGRRRLAVQESDGVGARGVAAVHDLHADRALHGAVGPDQEGHAQAPEDRDLGRRAGGELEAEQAPRHTTIAG
jgi:hypothetical protein